VRFNIQTSWYVSSMAWFVNGFFKFIFRGPTNGCQQTALSN
jgi:hypothetical protein